MLITLPNIPKEYYYYDEIDFKYKLVDNAPPNIVKIFNEWEKEKALNK